MNHETCTICGKEYPIFPSYAKRRPAHRCPDCRTGGNTTYNPEAHPPCRTCGKPVRQRKYKYCSHECKRIDKIVVVPCSMCGDTFEIYKNETTRTQPNGKPHIRFYCSNECRYKHVKHNWSETIGKGRE